MEKLRLKRQSFISPSSATSKLLEHIPFNSTSIYVHDVLQYHVSFENLLRGMDIRGDNYQSSSP